MHIILDFAIVNLLGPALVLVALVSVVPLLNMLSYTSDRGTEFIANTPDRKIARQAKKITAHADRFEMLPNSTAREAFLIRSGIASSKNANIIAHIYMRNVLRQDGATGDALNNHLSTHRNHMLSLHSMREMVSQHTLALV